MSKDEIAKQILSYLKDVEEYCKKYIGKRQEFMRQYVKSNLDMDNTVKYSMVNDNRFFVTDANNNKFELFVDVGTVTLLPVDKNDRTKMQWYRTVQSKIDNYEEANSVAKITGFDYYPVFGYIDRLSQMSIEQVQELQNFMNNELLDIERKSKYLDSHIEKADYNITFYDACDYDKNFNTYDEVATYLYSFVK